MKRFFRDAAWLCAARAGAYCRLLAVISAVLLAGWIGLGLFRGGVDFRERPLGPDFAPYWTAAELAASGRAAEAYDPAIHFAEERALFADPALAGPTPFFYPPTFLLLVRPLAALPYAAALLVWTALGLAAYWATTRAIWPGQARSGTLAALAFPAVLIDVANGQNGLFSAALLAGAALMLERRPALAGMCLGCLAYKPHLAFMTPFALLAWRAWPALLGAAAAFLALAGASLAAFGLDAWRAFFAASGVARGLLDHGGAGPEKMTSVFAAFQLWHAPLPVAYAAQAVGAAVALAGTWSLRHARDPLVRGAALAAAAPLASPYMFDYDLAVMAVPMAYLMRAALAGDETGEGRFLPWEKATLGAAFIAPLVARGAAGALLLPLGPPVAAALFWAVWRRGRRALQSPVSFGT